MSNINYRSDLRKLLTVRPVAQLVERWTPGSESPGEVSEWGGPCSALKGTLNFRF